MKVRVLSIVFLATLMAQVVPGQTIPKQVTQYLNRNFSGWKIAGECYEKDNKQIVSGDFDGNGKRDYALKFSRGERGFMMAFLGIRKGYKPFYLHFYSADDARLSDLMLFEKGKGYEFSGPSKLKYDAVADFRCESDSGGLHVYRNGKFLSY